MAFRSSLLAVRTKLAVKEAQIAVGLATKFAVVDPFNPFGDVGRTTGRVVPPVRRNGAVTTGGTFVARSLIPEQRNPAFDAAGNLIPLPGALDPRLGGGAGAGGLGAAACNLLSGISRELCLLALGLIPGGGGGGTEGLVADCPGGMVKVGKNCIDLTALPPGGDPAVIPAGGGGATVGAFGLPALTPTGVSRLVRRCGRGMVLGVDNLCYPKAVLTGRSKFRKWRRPVRPPVTRRDVVAIRRASGARDRVAELAKEVGLKIGAKRKKKAPSHHHHP